jgi:hypothetical protein
MMQALDSSGRQPVDETFDFPFMSLYFIGQVQDNEGGKGSPSQNVQLTLSAPEIFTFTQ